MFKLRVYAEVGSSNYNEGIKTGIWSHGTKKEMVALADKHNLKCKVLRTSDNKVVYVPRVKIYRLELIEGGEYYVLTEAELKAKYTPEEIESFNSDDTVTFYELPITPRQLESARKNHNDSNYLKTFEDEFSISPSLYDIVEHMYLGGN